MGFDSNIEASTVVIGKNTANSLKNRKICLIDAKGDDTFGVEIIRQ